MVGTIRITYFTHNFGVEYMEVSSDDAYYQFKEDVFIIQVLRNGTAIVPRELTAKEQLFITGAIRLEDIKKSDFRKAGVDYWLTVSVAPFVFVPHVSTGSVQCSEMYSIAVEMGSSGPVQIGEVCAGTVVFPALSVITASDDWVGLYDGETYPVKAGIPMITESITGTGTNLFFYGFRI